jgi:hypothetical protein
MSCVAEAMQDAQFVAACGRQNWRVSGLSSSPCEPATAWRRSILYNTFTNDSKKRRIPYLESMRLRVAGGKFEHVARG